MFRIPESMKENLKMENFKEKDHLLMWTIVGTLATGKME